MLPLGVLLLVSNSWLNSGGRRPWPNIEVEEKVQQLKILHSCARIGWILGFFMLLNVFYNINMWTSAALWTLIYDKLP